MIDSLVEYRVRAGLTQLELSRRIDRYPSVISNLEAGGRRIDLVELVELSEAMGFDIHELVDLVVAADAPGDRVDGPAAETRPKRNAKRPPE